MASFEMYCPCKVKEMGSAVITGNSAYILWRSKKEREEKEKPFTTCKHCGESLRYVGDDPEFDKQYKQYFDSH